MNTQLLHSYRSPLGHTTGEHIRLLTGIRHMLYKPLDGGVIEDELLISVEVYVRKPGSRGSVETSRIVSKSRWVLKTLTGVGQVKIENGV